MRRVGSGQAIDKRALPDLPSAITLAAAVNDVVYFQSIFSLIAAKAARDAAKVVPTSTTGPDTARSAQSSDATGGQTVDSSRSDASSDGSAPTDAKASETVTSPAADSSPAAPGEASPAVGNGTTGTPAASTSVTGSGPRAASGSFHGATSSTLPTSRLAGGASRGVSVATLANYVDKRAHGDSVLQIACAAGSADVVRLFLEADPTLIGAVKSTTGNTLLHYAALGPVHVADLYKAVRTHLLHNPDLCNVTIEPIGDPAAGFRSATTLSASVVDAVGLDVDGRASPSIVGGESSVIASARSTSAVSIALPAGADASTTSLRTASGAAAITAPHSSSISVPHGLSVSTISLPTVGAAPGGSSMASAAAAGANAIKMTGLQYLQTLKALHIKVSALVAAQPSAAPGTPHAALLAQAQRVRPPREGSTIVGSRANSGNLSDDGSGTPRPVSQSLHAPDAAAYAPLDPALDLASRFPPRSVERTVAALLAQPTKPVRARKNAFGRTPHDVAVQYTQQIMPESTLSALSTGSVLSEGTGLWERLLHPTHTDWDKVSDQLFDPHTMALVRHF